MPQPLFIRFLQPRGWTQRPVQGDATFELALAEAEHTVIVSSSALACSLPEAAVNDLLLKIRHCRYDLLASGRQGTDIHDAGLGSHVGRRHDHAYIPGRHSKAPFQDGHATSGKCEKRHG